MSKPPSAIQKFLALSEAEKEKVWESFNREISRSETRPLTPAQRAQWREIRRDFKKAGRPKVGGGAARVQITVEKNLLKKADDYARRHGMSRSQLVARGLQSVVKG